jgi:hypothetical protein
MSLYKLPFQISKKTLLDRVYNYEKLKKENEELQKENERLTKLCEEAEDRLLLGVYEERRLERENKRLREILEIALTHIRRKLREELT